MTLNSFGAVIFGVVVGFITYRTLVRTVDQTAVSDVATVVGAIGGGAVTAIFDPAGRAFAWYAIGLAVGMTVFFLLFLTMNGKPLTARMMSGETRVGANPPGGATATARYGGPQE